MLLANKYLQCILSSNTNEFKNETLYLFYVLMLNPNHSISKQYLTNPGFSLPLHPCNSRIAKRLDSKYLKSVQNPTDFSSSWCVSVIYSEIEDWLWCFVCFLTTKKSTSWASTSAKKSTGFCPYCEWSCWGFLTKKAYLKESQSTDKKQGCQLIFWIACFRVHEGVAQGCFLLCACADRSLCSHSLLLFDDRLCFICFLPLELECKWVD